jgi:3-oxoacyl-[acyl-carrier-protein] synthase II
VPSRRVVVTGLGALTPVGNTAAELWASLTQGRSGIGPITKFDVLEKDDRGEYRYATRIAGEVRDFDATRYIDRKEVRRLDLYLQYAIACAAMAVEDAGVDPARVDSERFGVLIGSGIGGIKTLLDG